MAGAIEMAIITGQAIRGRRSHFNIETPFDGALFTTMGVTIAVLWLATLVIAVLLLPRPHGDRAADLGDAARTAASPWPGCCSAA